MRLCERAQPVLGLLASSLVGLGFVLLEAKSRLGFLEVGLELGVPLLKILDSSLSELQITDLGLKGVHPVLLLLSLLHAPGEILIEAGDLTAEVLHLMDLLLELILELLELCHPRLEGHTFETFITNVLYQFGNAVILRLQHIITCLYLRNLVVELPIEFTVLDTALVEQLCQSHPLEVGVVESLLQ